MRYAMLVVLLGCTKAPPTSDETKPAIAPPPKVVAPTKPVSKVSWGCFHSNMPWGDGQQSWTVLYDLDAATLTRTSDETPNSPDGVGAPTRPSDGDDKTPPGKHEKTTKPLTADQVATVRAGIAKVLAGGPYEDEYPVPEGTPCDLEFLGPDGAKVFRASKAEQKKPDAVNAFIKTL